MRLPLVSAYFVLSIDGKIAAHNEDRSASASACRRRMLELRAETDAILTNPEMLEADGMAMRLPPALLRARRVREGRGTGPLRVVLSSNGRIRKSPGLFRKGGAPVVVFTTGAMPSPTRRWLEQVADVHVEPRGKKIDLPRVLKILAQDYRVRSALCEGGHELFRSLVAAGLVRRLHVTFAPIVIGGADAPTLLGPGCAAALRRSVPLRMKGFRRGGELLFAEYRFSPPHRAQ